MWKRPHCIYKWWRYKNSRYGASSRQEPTLNFFGLARARQKAQKSAKAQMEPKITPKVAFCYIFEK
jgi:hypothetical protein